MSSSVQHLVEQARAAAGMPQQTRPPTHLAWQPFFSSTSSVSFPIWGSLCCT